jgi:hypothetical protein
MPKATMNELTFAGWLAEFTAVRTAQREQAGETVLIATAAIEERQVDGEGVVRRCDIRFNSARGRKLASGELKRPDVAEGRDPRNEKLRSDARRKALARGLPYYFTCNMAQVVLFEMAIAPGQDDAEIESVDLAPITASGEALAYRAQMQERWHEFLDRLELRLSSLAQVRPPVTTADVVALRDAIFSIANEASSRVTRRLFADPQLVDEVRLEAARSFNFPAALDSRFAARFNEEIVQILRFGAFVVAQKLILYRVLQDSGPRRSDPFTLDTLAVARQSTNPKAIASTLDEAFSLAIRRSGDYETAFLPEPFVKLLFSDPEGAEETKECQVGEVWHQLLESDS